MMTPMEFETIRIPLTEGYRIASSDDEGLIMQARWAIDQLNGLADSYHSWSEGRDFPGIKHMLDPNRTLRQFFSTMATYPRFVFPDGREELIEPKYLEPEELPLICQRDKPRSLLEQVYTTYMIPSALKRLDEFLSNCGTISSEARRIAVRAHILIAALSRTCSEGPGAPHPIAFDDFRVLIDLCEQMNIEIMVRETDEEAAAPDVAEAVIQRVEPALSRVAAATESLSGQIANANRNVLRARKESHKEQAQIRKNTVKLLHVSEEEESLKQDDVKGYQTRATGIELEMLQEVYRLYDKGTMKISPAAERVFRKYTADKKKFTFKDVKSFKTQAYRYCHGQSGD